MSMAEGRPAGRPRRNLSQTLKSRLPAPLHTRIEAAGRLAQTVGVSAYLVGGFVRDLLLDRPSLDLDLVVEGDGIAFAEAYADAGGGRVISRHPRFGTAVVVFPDGGKLDVATARTEYYAFPAALPTVEPSSIKKDLYRRDFTINTLAIRLEAARFGELLDFYGGQRDLYEGVIRVLHRVSFLDDPTRVFRAVRFEQRFGFRLAPETRALIERAVAMKLFDRLSADRLRQELILLCSEDDPRPAIRRLVELKLLPFIHPGLAGLRSVRRSRVLTGRLDRIHQTLDWHRVASLNWPPPASPVEAWVPYVCAVMEALPPPAVRQMLRRLRFAARQAGMVRLARIAADRILGALRRGPRPSAVLRALEGLPDEVVLFLAAKAPTEAIGRLLTAYLSDYRFVRPTLTGHDLKAMGLRPGPAYKTVLTRLRAARLDGVVTTEAEERAQARKIVQSVVRRGADH